MALQLLKEASSGAVAEYWRIVFVQIDHISGQSFTLLKGYKTKEYRDSGAPSVFEATLSWVAADSPFKGEGSNDPRVCAYGAIKLRPEFEGAKDV